MKKVIQERRIDTYFQPILCLKTGNTLGFEVLNRPKEAMTFQNTERFYDFIGRSGDVFFIEKFLRQVSVKRFSQMVKVRSAHKKKMIFLNVHPQVLADSSYKTGETLDLLARHGFSPDQVVLELTEKEAVTDYEQFVKVIEHYKQQGFRIAVDDAGTGYNSLKTILYVKPEFIKLDKSLIRGIEAQFMQ